MNPERMQMPAAIVLTNATPRTFWFGVFHPINMDKRGVVDQAMTNPTSNASTLLPFPPVVTPLPATLTAGIATVQAAAPTIMVVKSLDMVDDCLMKYI